MFSGARAFFRFSCMTDPLPDVAVCGDLWRKGRSADRPVKKTAPRAPFLGPPFGLCTAGTAQGALDMRRSIAATVAALGLLAGPAALAQELKTEDDKVIYTLGTLIGRSLGGFSLSKAELEVLKRGMSDQLTGKPLALQTTPYEAKVRELEKARVQVRAKAYLDKAAKEP